MNKDHDKIIIIFDGVCNLCNWAVNYVIQRDIKNLFIFTPLQSLYGQKLSEQYHIDLVHSDSIQLIKDEKVYIESNAILEILRELSGFWRVLWYFKFIPKFIRDYVYRWIARNRYRIFGKKETCMVPTAETLNRFKLE